MSKKALKQAKNKPDFILFDKIPSIKAAVSCLDPSQEINKLLQDALLDTTSGNSRLIGLYRKLMTLIRDKQLNDAQSTVLLIAIVINSIEIKQLRQLAGKLLLALAECHQDHFNHVISAQNHINLTGLMHIFLFCAESVKFLDTLSLKSVWADYFSIEPDKIDDTVAFMFGSRAFNAYIGAVDKYLSPDGVGAVVDEAVVSKIKVIAQSKHVNRDTRQVLGLICIALKKIETGSNLEAYKQLVNDSYLLQDTPDTDIEFYRFTLGSAVISKLKDIQEDRGVLYDSLLQSITDLTERAELDKLFTIMVFKSISVFLQAVFVLAQEEKLHYYPDDLERKDPLAVDRRMLAPHSAHTKTLLNLIQVHWSNKLEAVRRTVGDIHSYLIQVITLLCGEEAARGFLSKQVENLLSLPWSVHGKYLALSQLVPVVGTTPMLQVQADLPLSILEVMAVQQTVASQCAALFYQLYKYDDTAHSHETWLLPLTNYLTNNAISDYCLRPIIEFDGGSLYYLRDVLTRDNQIDELLRILREGRKLGYLDVVFSNDPELFTSNQDEMFDVPLYHIKGMCDSIDDDRVLSVICLLSETNKTALPITLTELDLMQYILKYNEIRQTPAFRKGMFDGLDKFLARVLTSSTVLYRHTNTVVSEEDKVLSVRAAELIQHYIAFIKSCTNECFAQLYPSSSFQRQVTVIGVLEKFYKYFTNSKLIDLSTDISDVNLNKLISGVSSPFESVRSASLHCIAAIRHIPPAILTFYMDKVVHSLSSPKGVNSLVHSALFCFIFSTAVYKNSSHPTHVISSGRDCVFVDLLTKGDSSSALNNWITGILDIIDYQIKIACENLMEAAQSNPIFPAFNLLQVILKDKELKERLGEGERRRLVSRLLEYSTQLTDLLHEPITDDSPEGILLMGCLEEGGPCGPQLLMSMTWRTMQSLCSCLVLLVGTGKECLMTSPDIDERIGVYLRDLMLKVRHHGVFENVHLAFISYSSTMWARCPERLITWLDEVLCNIERSRDDMTYTRRSAGIPSVIQAILVTEPTQNGKPKLRETITRLLILSEHQDLITGRIHALNILFNLFKDSKLAEFVIPFVGQGFRIAIKGFSNTLWPLRNASTMFFSVLMGRMFNFKQNASRQATDVTFFTLFPDLHPFFLTELTRATADPKCLYYPSLYPILLLLQRLQPCLLATEDPKLSLSPFISIICNLARSGVLKTRSLAAETLSSIIPVSQLSTFAAEQIARLGKDLTQNHVHGILLQVKHILPKHIQLCELLNLLVQKCWLLTGNRCPFTSLLYVELLSTIINSVNLQDISPETSSHLEVATSGALVVIQTSGVKQGPVSCLREGCVDYILSLRSPSLAKQLLDLQDIEITRAVFVYPEVESWLKLDLDDAVLALQSDDFLDVTLVILKQLEDAEDRSKVHAIVYAKVLSVIESSTNPSRQTQAVQIFRLLDTVPDIDHVLEILGPLCSPLNLWNLRIQLPACYKMIYSNTIPISSEKEGVEQQSRVLWYLVLLLQDEDDGVRRNACCAILTIIQHHVTDISSELGLPILLEHLTHHSPHFITQLLHWIYNTQLQDLITSQYSKQYKSEGYAAVLLRSPSPQDHEHPLFDPDVVNAYAEPLYTPICIKQAFENLLREQGSCVERTVSGEFRQSVCEISAIAHTEYSELVCCFRDEGSANCHFADSNPKDYVAFSKIKIFSECMLIICKLFNVEVGEDWQAVLGFLKPQLSLEV